MVRLSDNQISEILSLPMAMVTGDSGAESAAGVAKSNHNNNSPNLPTSSSIVCDKSSSSSTTSAARNLLHMNKVYKLPLKQLKQ